jgi:TPR repeat protein
MVVLIGKEWANLKDEHGNRRLDDPHDKVRFEISQAFLRDLAVIPVSVDGATVPKATQLPDNIMRLSHFQAMVLRAESFASDAEAIAQQLKAMLIERRPRGVPVWAAGAAAVATLIAGIAAGALMLPMPQPAVPSPPTVRSPERADNNGKEVPQLLGPAVTPPPTVRSPERADNKGKEVPQPPPQSTVALLEGAAENGNAEAMFKLGKLYDEGSGGVAQDYAKARVWYEKASEKGDMYAMNNLGHLYDLGLGVAPDYAKARDWYEKAADKGDDFAMFNLGSLYETKDHSMAPDYSKARVWYEKAADKGHVVAMVKLGKLYASGELGAPDYAKARDWYEKAVGKGNTEAMNKLGLLYACGGKGLARDIEKGRELFLKSIRNNDYTGKLYLERWRMNDDPGC